jgi:hypothetical protein
MEERNLLERRSGWDRRNLSQREAEALRLCRLAGAFFHGIQPGFGDIPDQLLFGSAPISTTLCLDFDERLSPERIAARLSASERRAASLAKRFRKPFEVWSTETKRTSVRAAAR